VNWLPDGKTLAIQRESRDQRRLDLLFADIETGRSRIVLTETSATWIELNDEISFLRKSRQFIWASSRDGFEHLYLYDYDGRLERRLTAGAWNVDDFRGRAIKAVDEVHRLVYFTGTENEPDPASTLHRLARHQRSEQDHAHFARGRRARDHDVGGCAESTSINSRAPPSRCRRVCMRIDGSRIAYLLENPLDETHPDAPYLKDNSIPEFGTLAAADGQMLYYRLFKPLRFDPAKRYPAIVEVYGGPGVQRVLDNWTGNSFTQILTRAGYVVFQLDNRGSGFRGTAFQAPIHGRLGEIEVPRPDLGRALARRAAYVDPRASASGAGATAAT
jgi:dipeptidyl-peptidase 4